MFHDLETTIEGGHERNGLYEIEPVMRSLQPSTSTKDIKKWHCGLGHLSFSGHRSLILLSNIKSTVNELECEVCQLSNKCRTSYPISINERVKFLLLSFIVMCGMPIFYFWSKFSLVHGCI